MVDRVLGDARVAIDGSELMQRLVSNDREALAQVYEHFGALVHSIALRSVGSHHDAEDITQQVFLSLWRGRAALDPGTGSLAGWLATVTRRRCADHHEARARASRHDQILADGAPTAARMAAADDVTDRVVLAHELAALGDPRATIIRMAIIEDRRQQDIAEALDLPLGTVKSHLRRGLLDLRTRLEEVRP